MITLFQHFVIEYGHVRLQVKRANIQRLELQLSATRDGSAANKKRLRLELNAAQRSANATIAALEKAGEKDP